ncbi:hypothetical protein OOA_11028 [Providencia burhodogranariea DSM 19968]|uniref:Uncharacterized protein n=1 Tax=Providencia burhodogranariea DSM 19968 TaxID=1141662 RepID=K8WM90_9GAMM|nr:hypothetical protein OOA_11028 [Providencia burhodogranariea DSM 19968]
MLSNLGRIVLCPLNYLHLCQHATRIILGIELTGCWYLLVVFGPANDMKNIQCNYVMDEFKLVIMISNEN